MFPVIRFYDSERDFRGFYHSLKQVCCPHCKRAGNLILHGYLYGYSDGFQEDSKTDSHLEKSGLLENGAHHQNNDPPECRPDHRIVRGHRIFCSNRHRRLGCGKTISILGSACLRGFVVTAITLWAFLANVAELLPKRTAFVRLECALCNSAAYRLFRRVILAQSRIRSFLMRHISVPEPPQSHNPIMATLVHLQTAFPDSLCPISAFQNKFQVSFL